MPWQFMIARAFSQNPQLSERNLTTRSCALFWPVIGRMGPEYPEWSFGGWSGWIGCREVGLGRRLGVPLLLLLVAAGLFPNSANYNRVAVPEANPTTLTGQNNTQPDNTAPTVCTGLPA